MAWNGEADNCYGVSHKAICAAQAMAAGVQRQGDGGVGWAAGADGKIPEGGRIGGAGGCAMAAPSAGGNEGAA